MKYKFSDVITCQISNYRITVNRKKKKTIHSRREKSSSGKEPAWLRCSVLLCLGMLLLITTWNFQTREFYRNVESGRQEWGRRR